MIEFEKTNDKGERLKAYTHKSYLSKAYNSEILSIEKRNQNTINVIFYGTTILSYWVTYKFNNRLLVTSPVWIIWLHQSCHGKESSWLFQHWLELLILFWLQLYWQNLWKALTRVCWRKKSSQHGSKKTELSTLNVFISNWMTITTTNQTSIIQECIFIEII